MAPYEKLIWVDEIPDSPPRYEIIDDVTGSVADSATIELVTPIATPGTPVIAANMNNIEDGIEAVTATVDARIDASGNLTLADHEVQRPVLKDYSESINAIGAIGGGTQDVDLEAGNVVTATVDTSETTFTFSHPSPSGTAGSFTLILTNGGSQTVNWPATVQWAGGTAPALTAAGVDILTFLTLDAGVTWYGFLAGLDFS